MYRVFTEAEKEFIFINYPQSGAHWVAEMIGKDIQQVRAFTSRHHIMRTNRTHKWTASEIEKLKAEFPNRKTEYLANEFGLDYHVVSNMAYRLRLKKTDKFLKSPDAGRLDGRNSSATHFPKGHVPHNKGQKMSPEIRERVKQSWFTKGHLPHNTKHDGYQRITKDGYIEIRVSQGNFELLHRYNWQQRYGPIPEGIIMRCKDGNVLNCDPENWFLIDRQSQIEINTGREALTDKYILAKLSPRNIELRQVFAEMPELIELKRNEFKLKRTINELTETSTND